MIINSCELLNHSDTFQVDGQTEMRTTPLYVQSVKLCFVNNFLLKDECMRDD